MASLPHNDIKPYDPGGDKKSQVGEMFDRLAPRYDLVNRVLSAGVDVGWRKKAIRMLQPLKPLRILDVATGTADMAIRAAAMLRPQKIEGIDISEGMLSLGRDKVKAARLESVITLHRGDGETINFEDGSFDAVMVAFGVRNFADLPRGLAEMHRVLRPGGTLMVLEFSTPRLALVKPLYAWYMQRLAPGVAGMLKQEKSAYQYLQRSAAAFPDGEKFLDILRGAGFRAPRQRTLTLGICSIYLAQKD